MDARLLRRYQGTTDRHHHGADLVAAHGTDDEVGHPGDAVHPQEDEVPLLGDEVPHPNEEAAPPSVGQPPLAMMIVAALDLDNCQGPLNFFN